MYSINTCQEQKDSQDVVIGMIRVLNFIIYVWLDLGANLSFVTPYVAINFDIILKKLSEPFNISTPVDESI